MRATIERTFNEAFLIIEEGNLCGSNFEIQMLAQNEIKGILPLFIKESENGRRFMYNIRGRVSLSAKYEKQELRSDSLRKIIGGLQENLSCLEEYMISTDHAVLSPDYLFVDSVTGELCLCVVPFGEQTFADGLKELSEFLIAKTDHNENLAIDLAYGFYRQVMSGDYRFDELAELTATDKPVMDREDGTDKAMINTVTAERRDVESGGNEGKSIILLLIVSIVIFCFALCVLMLYFR